MAGVFTSIGMTRFWNLFLNKGGVSVADFYVKLFVNNHTPTAADTVADYTECSLVGYGPQASLGSDFTLSGSDPVLASAPAIWSMTLTGPGTVYGAFITDIAGSQLYWAVLAPSPISIDAGGTPVQVNLNFSLGNA